MNLPLTQYMRIGEQNYNSTHSSPWHYIEVNVYLQDPDNLRPGKAFPVHIRCEVGRAPDLA